MNQKSVERDLLQQEYESNESQLAQLKHQQERLENRIAYYEKGSAGMAEKPHQQTLMKIRS